VSFDLRPLTVNEWLAADMEMLHEATAAVTAFRQGQDAARGAAKARAG